MMPCDVCGHTIQKVAGGSEADPRWFWCSRCGTLHEIISDRYRASETPSLLRQVQKAQQHGCFRIDDRLVSMLPEVWNPIAECAGMEKIA